MATVVEGDPKDPFSKATTGVGEGATPFPGLLHFTLDPYHIMLSVKQGGIKYHFLSLWYDLTWDWTPVSQTISEHSTTFIYTQRKTAEQLNIKDFSFSFLREKEHVDYLVGLEHRYLPNPSVTGKMQHKVNI